jgi:hypothetical protein
MVDTDGSRFFVVYNDDIHPPPGPLRPGSSSAR